MQRVRTTVGGQKIYNLPSSSNTPPQPHTLRQHEYNKSEHTHVHTNHHGQRQHKTKHTSNPSMQSGSHTATGKPATNRWSEPDRHLGLARPPNRPANPAVKLLLLLRRQAVVVLRSRR